MTISAKVIADSISHLGKRITTLELRYPRFIHAEFMTHRVFSRNASSSRAIPVERMIQDVIDDPAMPIHWGKNQPGMQAWEDCHELVTIPWDDGPLRGTREAPWLFGRDKMTKLARAYAKAGYHKQIVNRLLEPWLHINVVVTSTEWDNFFALRLHKDAQPEIHELARCMKQAIAGSTPRPPLGPGEWHLPYVTDEDWEMIFSQNPNVHGMDEAKMLSVARCASVSYKTVDGQPMTLERAQAIYDKLVKADVFHASPFEHQATPDVLEETMNGNHIGVEWKQKNLHGNFVGWIQNRKIMESNLSL